MIHNTSFGFCTRVQNPLTKRPSTNSSSETGPLTSGRHPLVQALFVLIFTASCSTVPPQDNAPPPSTPRVAETSNPQYDQKQLAIARLMEQAHQAMDDQRLTEPEDQSALSFYRAILQIDPNHQGAREGIHQIVERYLTWALEAIDDLAFTKASLWLERAALADPKAPAIFTVAERLALKRSLSRRTIVLPEWVTSTTDLPNHDSATQRAVNSFFQDIAISIREQGATIVIYSRSDEEGRWIYQSVNQYMPQRLRATLELDRPTRIDLIFSPSPSPSE